MWGLRAKQEHVEGASEEESGSKRDSLKTFLPYEAGEQFALVLMGATFASGI